MNLLEIIEALDGSFRSIDIRCASYRIGDSWYALVAYIRFVNEEPATVEEKVSRLWSKLPLAEVDGLTVLRESVASAHWSELRGEIERGVLTISGQALRLIGPTALTGANANLDSYHSIDPSCEYPCFAATIASNSPLDDNFIRSALQYPEGNERLRAQLGARGYKSIADAVRPRLELQRDSRDFFGSQVHFSIPVYGCITGIEIIGQELRVTARLQRQNVGQFRLYGGFSSAEHPVHHHPALQLNISEDIEDDFVVCVATSSAQAIQADQVYEVRLSHEVLGIVEIQTYSCRDLLPALQINPLWALFQRFCPANELSDLLADAGNKEPDPKQAQPQRQFERHVGWLLSCFGFSTIVLGKHEKLHSATTRVELGSLDILAFHPLARMLLLVDCSFTVPDQTKLASLVNVRELLLRGIPGAETFSTALAIFTSAAKSEPSFALGDVGYGIPSDTVAVFDGPRMREAVNALQAGRLKWLCEQLNSVAPSDVNFWLRNNIDE